LLQFIEDLVERFCLFIWRPIVRNNNAFGNCTVAIPLFIILVGSLAIL